jgi:hypothetical protein
LAVGPAAGIPPVAREAGLRGKSMCLDWLLILNRRYLESVLRVFVDHYSVCDRPVVRHPARLAVSGARWSAPAAGV